MIKLKISNKFLTEYILHNNHRLLSVQHNVNKCGVSYYSMNYQRNNKSNLSRLSFSKQLLQNNLYSLSAAPSYMNIQRRHLSDQDLIKNLPQKPTPPESPPPPDPETILPDSITQFTDDVFTMPEFLVKASQNQPITFIQDLIIEIHEELGLSWWATISLTAFCVHFAMLLPFSISQIRNKNRLLALKNHMEAYKKKLQTETKEFSTYYGWPEEIFKDRFNKLMKKEEEIACRTLKCHPKKAQVATSARLILWIATSLAIRNLCFALPPSVNAVEIYRQMSFDGFSWLLDLTQPDIYFVLPFIYSLLNYGIIESKRLFCLNPKNVDQQFKYLSLHFLNLLIIPVAVNSPAAVNLYWVTSSSIRLGELYLLHSPIFQRISRMPPLSSKEPYTLYYKQLKAQLLPKPTPKALPSSKDLPPPKTLDPSKQIE